MPPQLSIAKKPAGGCDEQDLSSCDDVCRDCTWRLRRIFVDAGILESNAGCDWIVEHDIHAERRSRYDPTEYRLNRELQSKWQ